MQGPNTGTSRWPHFCFHGVLVFGGKQEVFNGAVTFEVGLYAIPTTDPFDAFAQTLGADYDYMTLRFDFIGGGLSTSCSLVVSIITVLTGQLSKSSFHPV